MQSQKMARNEEKLNSLKKWVSEWVENKCGEPNYDDVIISWLDSVKVPIKGKYLVSCFLHRYSSI